MSAQFVLIREPSKSIKGKESVTLGKLYYNGICICETLEDNDRRLESGGTKIQNVTAIPRGIYSLIISMSNRFKKLLPEVLSVNQFKGVRIHGGNTAENSEGCILVGLNRSPDSTSISNCAPALKKVMDLIALHPGIQIEIK